MFYPFEIADPTTTLHYRPSDARLAEVSLAPLVTPWIPKVAIIEAPDPVWAQSLANAQTETVAAVSAALQELCLSSPTLRPVDVSAPPAGRAGQHLTALMALWQHLGPALPEGLEVARHVLELPYGQCLDNLPVVAGSLDPNAPPAMQALYNRLRAEFGEVSAKPTPLGAQAGSRLYDVQAGLSRPDMPQGKLDGSLAFFGLRDSAACADFAAARARALIAQGCPARDIAVLAAGDPSHIARAFAGQGVPLSGLPAHLPERDLAGETMVFLLQSKRTPTPAMALASLCLSPLMPWAAQTGRDLSEQVMRGRFKANRLDANPDHKALWEDIRHPATSLAQLRFLLESIISKLPQATGLRDRFLGLQSVLAGEGSPDWETILKAAQMGPATAGEPVRNLEGVSLWAAMETPWRPCQHLLIVDFTEGLYPARPHANPLFLDSEIEAVAANTGLLMRGRASGLARNLALFESQLKAVTKDVTFLIPWRGLGGGRQAPSAGLSLVARAIAGVKEPVDLIMDLSRVPSKDWPVASHVLPPLPDLAPIPEAVQVLGHDLLALRRAADGVALPQTPSRLENLLISPLAWLLEEVGAIDLSWTAETLDAATKGNIAHDVFEHVFLADVAIPDETALLDALPTAFDAAVTRQAGFLRSPVWEMERGILQRDIRQAALRWGRHLGELGARIICNEKPLEGRTQGIEVRGDAHGIGLRGKADCILALPNEWLLIVDHKKSGTNKRRKRMEAGWDLQAGLYRDMLARPIRREGDGLDALMGRAVGVAYHMMNDGGLLTSGVDLAASSPAKDMGQDVNAKAIAKLKTRLAEVGSGKIVLNTTADAAFFEKEAGIAPYVLERSPLIAAFTRKVAE